MDYVTLECKTSGCENQYLPFDVEDNGTEIICSGSCGNILRANTPEHPNYPHIPIDILEEIEQVANQQTQFDAAVDARLEEKLRELGIIE